MISIKTRIQYVLKEKIIRPSKLSLKFILDCFCKQSALVMGDSHMEVFNSLHMKYLMPKIRFDVCAVKGATASGLENPNSKTQAYQQFRTKLDHIRKDERIIINLGEVDVGFVIWYRVQKYNEKLNAMFDLAVNNYCKLIKEITSISDRKPIVISVPLPTIGDDHCCGEVGNLRRDINASQKERTNITLEFNKATKDYCKQLSVHYIDLDKDSLDQNGLVKAQLLNKDKGDHHYDAGEYAKLIHRYLKPYFMESQ